MSAPITTVPVLVEAGRQALGLLAQDARAAGMREVLVPSVACVTMVVPFEREGMHVTVVPCGRDALLESDRLADTLTECAEPPLVLHSETFGNRASPALTAVLAHARQHGAHVVVDVTHSLLDHPRVLDALTAVTASGTASAAIELPDEADHLVAGCRKLLPVALGGLAAGVQRAPATTRAPIDEDVLDVARLAVLHPEVLALRDSLEDLLDEAWVPAAMPTPTRERLAGLDLVLVAAQAREEMASLHARLLAPDDRADAATESRPGEKGVAGVDLVNPGASYFPVMRHEKAEAMRRILTKAGLSLPLRWPGAADDLVVLPNEPRAIRLLRRLVAA